MTIEKIEQDIHRLIEMAIQEGYNEGFKDGQSNGCQTVEDKINEAKKNGYDNGLIDAWECAKDIYEMDCEEISNIFPNAKEDNIFACVSPCEATARVRKHKENKKCKVCNNCPNHGYCDYE